MKGAFASLVTIIASLVLLTTVASAQPDPIGPDGSFLISQAEQQSQNAAHQAKPSSGQSSGAAGMGMMGQSMMGGPAMMGPRMMGGPGGMMPGCMMDMQMMMNDPKIRGQMM